MRNVKNVKRPFLLCFACLLSSTAQSFTTLRRISSVALSSKTGVDGPEGLLCRHTTLGEDTSTLRAKTNHDSVAASYSQAFDSKSHRTRLLIKCALGIVLYMAIGVLSFSRVFEKWSILDSLYFSVVTFTTVGYGDLCPSTEAGKLFATFFSFGGIAIVGALLAHVGANIVEAERNLLIATRSSARKKVMALFNPRLNHTWQIPRAGGGLWGAMSIRSRSDGSKSLLRKTLDVVMQSNYVTIPFVSLALFIGKLEGWTIISSLYYAFATASTVGYGDFAPTTKKTKLLSLLFVPLAVISLGDILSRIAGHFISKEIHQMEHEYMHRTMNLQDLEAMDVNHSGEVDLFEFTAFMLTSMGKVDRELMTELRQLFEKLDKTGSNSIQKEDLLLLAKKTATTEDSASQE